ncbi:MAG: transposase, partial [Solirubrobacteraceae bacterium]
MSQNFIACDRGQTMLLPPDLTEWVPDDHVVWSILGAVEQMDLSAFYGAYRENGQGRAAYEPSVMVALLLYSYARGNRSSRGIERACREDVTYKVITAMRVPDHSTIAEFRRRHERALGELFTEVLALCDQAGLVEVGVISIDGMKIRANASRGANRTYEKLVADILKEAEETDVGRTVCSAQIVAARCPSICGPRRGAGRRSRPRRSGWSRRPAVARSLGWRGSSLILSSSRRRVAGVGARGTVRLTKSCCAGASRTRSRLRARELSGCSRRCTVWRRTSRLRSQ